MIVRPRILMHGTPVAFSRFDPAWVGSTTSGREEDEVGFFFTARRRTALRYAQGPEGRIIHALVSPRNPVTVTGLQWGEAEGPSPKEAFDAGHDCLIVRPYFDGPMWLVLDPSLISIERVEIVRDGRPRKC